MADTLTKAQRSERMSRIKGKGTKTELTIRRLVHRLGYRYRLHEKDLPRPPRHDVRSPPGRHFRPWVFLAPTPRPKMPSCPIAKVTLNLLATQT
jgi:hypothetical protein